MPWLRNKLTGETKWVDDQQAAPQMPAADPMVIPPDPGRVAREQAEEARRRAAENRAQQGAGLAAASDARAADAAARARAEWTATHNEDGTPKVNADKPVKATEDENKSAAFYKRGLRAIGAYEKAGLGPRGAVGQGIAENMWGGEGLLRALPDAIGDSPDRQISEQAKRDFASALLRSDSGANAPEPEVARLIDTYFPRPNETDPKVLANYAAARAQALDALRARSGVLANTLPAYVATKPGDDPASDDGKAPWYGYDEENGLEVTVTDTSPSKPPSGGGGGGNGFFSGDYSPESLALGLAQGAGSVAEGIGDIPGMLGGNFLGQSLYDALGYDKRYDMGTALREGLGLPENPNPISRAIQRGGAAALSGAGAAGAARQLATGATARGALDTLAANPLQQMAAGGGAGAGGEIARESGAGPLGQLAAAMAGGAAGYGGAGALARGPRTPSPLMRAADSLKIDMLPADVGGPGTRMLSGAAGRTLGGVPMAEAAERSITSARNARDAIAARIGRINDPAGAGQATQRGAKTFIADSHKRGEDLFEQVSVQPKALAETTNTRTALSEIVRGMESNPELSKIWTGHPRLGSTLEALSPRETAADQQIALIQAQERLVTANARLAGAPQAENSAVKQELEAAKLAYNQAAQAAKNPPKDGTVSWEDMKRLRSTVGEIVGQPSLTSDGATNAAMRKFYGALTADMEATAGAAGPRALTEFRRANQFWRGRQDRIDNVLTHVLGNDMNKGEEAAFEQINRWAQSKGGDFNRLSRTIRSLPKDEADTVRASVLGRMGQAKPGQQNADGLQFSPATFATQWASLAPRAKSVLFPDLTHRKSIDDLALVMDGMKRAGEFSNFSNTSLGTNLVAHGAGMMKAPITTTLLAAGEFGLGKMLSSPKMARWLATIPEDPQSMASHIGRLDAIIAQDASIAGDARALQSHLQQSFGASPGRAAAEEKADRRRKPPAY